LPAHFLFVEGKQDKNLARLFSWLCYPRVRHVAGVQQLHPITTKGEHTMTETPKLTREDLMQFTGSENWSRHGLNPKVLFTDGAKHVAEEGGAYWLLDIIALAQRYEKRITPKRFQVWKLSVRPDNSATLTCEDGDCKTVYRQEIEYTDFP
jgi:hypothetical protein